MVEPKLPQFHKPQTGGCFMNLGEKHIAETSRPVKWDDYPASSHVATSIVGSDSLRLTWLNLL